MNKVTRLVAGALTSIVAVGAMALPVFAADSETSESLEESLCNAAAADIEELTELNSNSPTLIGDKAEAADDAREDMDAATDTIAAAALSYIRALDGNGDEEETFDAFLDAAVEFSGEVVDWLDAVGSHTEMVMGIGIHKVNLDYLNGICNPV